ncbi:MAG: hypothetical protein BroJett011_62590 [Chloroflexota bacterium]|nr:MAG: hypothetical protein BroJett011_62590 [Chloroflexota bacterium]
MSRPDSDFDPGQSTDDGLPFLISSRQQEVLYLAAMGQTDRAIARNLAIAPRTVRAHLQAIREALGARNTTHAVAIALSRHILDVEEAQWTTP